MFHDFVNKFDEIFFRMDRASKNTFDKISMNHIVLVKVLETFQNVVQMQNIQLLSMKILGDK